MKIIRNGVCFIEKEDLEFLGSLPDNIYSITIWDVSYSVRFNLLRYKSEEASQYFMKKNFILNYDDIKNLSKEELNKVKYESEKKLDELSLRWLISSKYTRDELNNDKKYNYNFKFLKYYIESLNKYINNKELYDEEISKLSFSNFKKTKLNKYSAVSKCEPISKISVSSTEMSKLDQSIKDKCRQNASEQARGRDAAKDFHVGTSAVDVEIGQGIKKLIRK